jgi:hypothetical protein
MKFGLRKAAVFGAWYNCGQTKDGVSSFWDSGFWISRRKDYNMFALHKPWWWFGVKGEWKLWSKR